MSPRSKMSGSADSPSAMDLGTEPQAKEMEPKPDLTVSLQVFVEGEFLSHEKPIKPHLQMSHTDSRMTRQILLPLLSHRRVSPRLLDQVKDCIKICDELSNYKSPLSNDVLFEQLEKQEKYLARAFEKEKEIFEMKTEMMKMQITAEKMKVFEEDRYLLTYGDYFADNYSQYRMHDKSKSLEGYWKRIQFSIRKEQEMEEREKWSPTSPRSPKPIIAALEDVSVELDYPMDNMLFDIKEYAKRNTLAHSPIKEYEDSYRWRDLANHLHRDQKNIYKFFKDKPEYQKMLWDTIETYKKRHFIVFEPGEIDQETGNYKFEKLVSRTEQKMDQLAATLKRQEAEKEKKIKVERETSLLRKAAAAAKDLADKARKESRQERRDAHNSQVEEKEKEKEEKLNKHIREGTHASSSSGNSGGFGGGSGKGKGKDVVGAGDEFAGGFFGDN